MRDAVIVEAVRTPVGKRNGTLSGLHPVALSAHVLNALAARTGIDPALVDDVIWGCVAQVGEQALDIARNAVLAAGWPETVPGVTVDRQCGSSQQALHFAAAGVIAGPVRPGGGRWRGVDEPGADGRPSCGAGMPLGPRSSWRALRRRGQPGRRRRDGRRALGAVPQPRWTSSRSARTRRPPPHRTRAGSRRRSPRCRCRRRQRAFDADEGVRRGGTVEVLAALKTPFRPDGVVTAGNSSQISDGAAALLVTTVEKAAELGLRPLARVHTARAGRPTTRSSCSPRRSRRPARRCSARGLGIDEIGAFEVNEAFAPVPLAWLAETRRRPRRR